jgi:ParB/RepB/Spo0J family partition protein
MATTTQETGRHIALVDIRVPDNVRNLDPEHVKALAGSIGLQGMLVPVVVRNDGEGFELVAGFHRVAAARSLVMTAVPVVIRDAQTEDADRAVENITRKQLNPYEEAKAVRAMLDRGLTEDGAAQALGWPKQRVTARVKLLELPERAQQLIGEGVIHLAVVDQLRAIGAVAPALLDAVIAYLDDDNAWAAERLMREPGWVLDAALTHSGDSKVFAAYLHSVSAHEIAELRLGKKTEQLYADAEKLHKQLDRYAYGPPQVRFTDEDVDQARAAGVLIEFERGRPIIVDRPLYRELVKTAIKRTHDDLKAKAESAAKDKEASGAGKALADPITLAKRERDAQLRELTDQAHGANTDLGHALIHNLTTVDPTDINVARFFVLCGGPHRTNYATSPTMSAQALPWKHLLRSGGLRCRDGARRVGIVSRGCSGKP